jgi:predicted PurR-regulated permease PerM
MPSARAILRVVTIVVVSGIALYVIYLLRKPLGWIFIAGFIAIALTGPVALLTRWMPRGLAIAVVFLLLIALPFLLMALILPPMISEVDKLIDNLPTYVADVEEFVVSNERLRELERDYQILDKLEERAQELPSRIGDAAAVLGGLGLGIVNSLFALVTILILAVFLVSSGPHWVQAALRLQPRDRRERLERTLRGIATAVGAYVAGALVQATVAGVLAFIVLSVLGMPFAGPLALLVALFDLVPLVGATLAALVVGLVTFFNDFPTTTIVWAIWSVAYQQIENNLIQPQIQKRAVDVHPFVVLTAVLFGSTLFGVLGALLAIPIAASIQISIREWWAWRLESRLEEAEDEPVALLEPPLEPPPAPG